MASKFYCLIAKHEGKENSHHLNSYFLIEENFYFYGHQVKNNIDEMIKMSPDSREGQSKPLKALSMGSTKMKELRVIFGRPYLFRHLEGCDHTIVFKDLRILS